MSAIPTISLHDFDARRQVILAELMSAATDVGFFTLSNHGIPQDDIAAAFELSRTFFALDDEVKAKTALNGKNAGWEKNTQVRPSTGTADQKESMQLQFARMEGLWPSDTDVEGFQDRASKFMHQVQDVEGKSFGANFWRAGAHADFDILTMLFQRDGEGGLEVCPGRVVVDDYGMGADWLPVEARSDRIVCNIGDQLMRWSDDRLKSTYHRVRLPEGDEPRGPRYSIAFFNQARGGVLIQGPQKKYPAITGAQFIADALARNRMQSAAIAAQARLVDAEKVATEVHFVPAHLKAAA
ncbi:hypothetical protein Q8F55_007340 [Vanrija albida]|uniref:Fe2OG dioxygenase domain-containing protein n=1 Tax=Vanrija albida TaxID=181172 RepID=A0ABR3PZH6_9TREE